MTASNAAEWRIHRQTAVSVQVIQAHLHCGMAAYLADASIGGEDDNGCQTAFQRSVEVGEAFNVQHVHLVNEQHPGYQLSHALINVPVHHLQWKHTVMGMSMALALSAHTPWVQLSV